MTAEAILRQRVRDWSDRHVLQEARLTGFLVMYGCALARFGETDVLGRILMRQYERTASFNRIDTAELLDWMFRPDDVEDVAWRMQLAASFVNTINLEA